MQVESSYMKPAYSAVIKFPDQKITVNLFSATYAAVHCKALITDHANLFSATYAAVHLENYQKKLYISTYNDNISDLTKYSRCILLAIKIIHLPAAQKTNYEFLKVREQSLCSVDLLPNHID